MATIKSINPHAILALDAEDKLSTNLENIVALSSILAVITDPDLKSRYEPTDNAVSVTLLLIERLADDARKALAVKRDSVSSAS
jgi:hypothetical protein